MRKACCKIATKRQKEKGVYNGLKSPCKRPFKVCKNGCLRVQIRQHAALSLHVSASDKMKENAEEKM